MVRFDRVADTISGFDPIRCDGSLNEIFGAEILGLPLEDAYELLTDDLPLGLWIGHALQCLEVLFACIYDLEIDAHVLQHSTDLIGLSLSHQSCVDIDCEQPVPYGLARNDCGDHTVHSSGTGDYRFTLYLVRNGLHMLFDEFVSFKHQLHPLNP